jgi:hypothetical protein
MATNHSWLIGRQLSSARKSDYTWFFDFAPDGQVATESSWRFTDTAHVLVTSEDNEQLFGLKDPVDAASWVLGKTKGTKITKSFVAERSSDLVIEFEGGLYLEFLCLSAGYESWRSYCGPYNTICTGGGKLVIWQTPPRSNQSTDPTLASGTSGAEHQPLLP